MRCASTCARGWTEDRNLDPDELATLAEDLAGHPELWRGFVQQCRGRIYTEIHRDHHLDVWLICWSGAQADGIDHDLSRWRGAGDRGRAGG
jgi:hypothetical protein